MVVMDCTITSSVNRRRGFTLSELLIGSGAASLLLTVLAALSIYGARSVQGLVNYSDLNAMGMNALDQMTRDIRQATSVMSASTNRLVFNRNTGQTPLTFSYNPETQTLTRAVDGVTNVLLTGCEGVKFSLYQRTPIKGTYDQYPPATAADAKVVGLEWDCSRSLLGRLRHSQHTLSAKVVIRKH